MSADQVHSFPSQAAYAALPPLAIMQHRRALPPIYGCDMGCAGAARAAVWGAGMPSAGRNEALRHAEPPVLVVMVVELIDWVAGLTGRMSMDARLCFKGVCAGDSVGASS